MPVMSTHPLGRDGGPRRPFRWPALLTPDGRGIAYGGDYNPDQWPEEVWAEDVGLMAKAGVNTVALGIFSWGRIQPSEDVWNFDWLDRIIAMLGRAGVAVDLATATASAPLWLYEGHPEILPVDINGTVINAGSRQSWRATSPVFRGYALELCRRLAERYADNPYVVAWHVNNEYGWNNRFDYSDDAARAFRLWCRRRYGSIDAVNDAWGTDFWSQQLHSFDQIRPPRHMGDDAMVNPGQLLDFKRFSSDALKDFFIAERDVVESLCPGKPCTTNFMVSTDQCAMDYADWSDQVDFVSNDHYFTPGEAHLDELACSDSLVAGFAQREPWYLMEHSTSAVQWKPVNVRKTAGELVCDGLAHVAMGADAVNFFQWRQSRSGAEAFHSAMLPHAGEDSLVFRDVCELGGDLKTLADAGLQGSVPRRGRVAILFDADSEWACESRTLPSARLSHWHDARDWYRAFLDVAEPADMVPARADWGGYDVVVAPSMVICDATMAARLTGFVRSGGTLVADYASGLADASFRVGLGGYPGMLRDLLGVRGEEFNIVGAVEGMPAEVRLSNGATSRLWQTVLPVSGLSRQTSVLATYEGNAAAAWGLDGMPAVTRHRVGGGLAYYVGCDMDRADIADMLRGALADCVRPRSATADPGVLRVVRDKPGMRVEFMFNRQSFDRRSFDCQDFDTDDHRGVDVTVTIPPEGKILVAYRAARVGDVAADGSAVYRLRRNGVIVVRRLFE